MNNEQLSKTKELYNGICKLINNPTIHISLLQAFPQIKNISPDKIFWIDTLKFMAYISSADGEISQREVNVMNYITGIYMPFDSVQGLIDDSEFLSDVTNVSLTVKILCEIENMLYRNDAVSGSNSLMNTLIVYFQSVGGLVADADNEISSIEFTRIDKYITAIKDYAKNNTLSPFFVYE
jgi:hypothetical protein